ncbi:MAG: GNAT family N-acetyltransferase [Capsulimonadales bacterium]|nr:GNAT family N-acetyltransferase [Capsulimonadales bacterium]
MDTGNELLREWRAGDFLISTDRRRVDRDTVHGFLSTESYWAQGVARETVERAIDGSPLVFGVYHAPTGAQVGMARVITDFATFSYLCDVFILPAHRGQGLSKWLMSVIWSMPELQGQRRWMLATADAHGLYSQFGFEPLVQPERWMWRKGTRIEQYEDR